MFMLLMGIAFLWLASIAPKMTETSGIIIDTAAGLKYSYRVGLMTYFGTWQSQFPQPRRIGSTVRVYFEPNHPEISSLQRPAFRWALVNGTACAITGVVIMNMCMATLTPNQAMQLTALPGTALPFKHD
jgi:hypothetical protein